MFKFELVHIDRTIIVSNRERLSFSFAIFVNYLFYVRIKYDFDSQLGLIQILGNVMVYGALNVYILWQWKVKPEKGK